MKNTIKIASLIALLFAAGFKASTHDTDDNFYFNPLVLDGKPMNLGKLSAATTGKLSVVKHNVVSDEMTAVPFVVYLKRNGMKVIWKSGLYEQSIKENQSVNEIELGPIMKTAVAGDELVIDPTNSEDKRWKRVILVNPAKLYPRIDWFYKFNKNVAGNKTGGGC